MYTLDNTTIDLYNDISSGFSNIIIFFPAINSDIITKYGYLQEINYTYGIQSNYKFPLKKTVLLNESIVLGLYEVRRQIHQNIKVEELYNGNEENPSGILYYLVKNWGRFGDNLLTTECLNALYKLMKFIQKQLSVEENMLKLVGELNIPQADLDKLISNIGKINLSSKSVDDLEQSLNKIHISSKTINNITEQFRKLKNF